MQNCPQRHFRLLYILIFTSGIYAVPPEQIHIALAGKYSDQMRISWVTPVGGGSEVQYGFEPTSLKFTAIGIRGSYVFQNYTSGFISHVLLKDHLFPATTYYYRCGSDLTEWSPIKKFRLPRAVGASSSVALGLLGDHGQTAFSMETVRQLQKVPLDAVLHVGDLSYADGFQPHWDSWGRLIEPVASRVPWMVVPGNHEVEATTSSPSTFVAYQGRFTMPYAESQAMDGSLYYSLNMGCGHFIFINPYIDFQPTSKQYQWLRSDLRTTDRNLTPWLIVVIHAPWYHTNKNHAKRTEPQYALKEVIEGLLNQYKVDIVISGHIHAYERTTEIKNNEITSGAPYYLTIGSGGNNEGLASEFLEPQPWSVFRHAAYGFGHMVLINATHTEFSWNELNGATAIPADSFTYVRYR